MKKIIYSTMMASLLALTGCQSEELVSDNSTGNSGKTVILTANIQGSPTTRVALTPDTDENENPIVKVAWREYDPENPETFIVVGDNAEPFTFTQISGTEFTGTLPVPWEGGNYLAVYNLTLYENFGKGNEFTFRQDGTLREQDMVMSSMFDTDDTSIEFKHQMSILKPTFTVDGENINSFITHIEMGKIYACSTTVVIDVEPTSPATTLKDDIYLTIPLMNDLSNDKSDFQAGETFDFTVTAGGKDYTGSLTIPAGMNIEAGNLYTASVQMNIVTTPYVTFSAEAAQTLRISTAVDGLEYSEDGGNSWQSLTTSIRAPFGPDNDLLLRGINSNGTGEATIIFSNNAVPVACSGDIRTLIDYRNYENVNTGSATFKKLFDGCNVLTSAPELPATTLADYCYHNMFRLCENLTAAPKLPATTLAANCYQSMFQSCTSLTAAPELPATTLAANCYESMFRRCENLTTAPELSATTLAHGCYGSMFLGCTSLKAAPELPPATTLADYCYSSMFAECSSLTSAPKLPVTTLAKGCYESMFMECSALTVAPELPATTLAAWCYSKMFYNCKELTTAPELPAENLINSCYSEMFYNCKKVNNITMLATRGTNLDGNFYNWVSGVASTGTFTKAVNANISRGVNGIPSGWTVIEQ